MLYKKKCEKDDKAYVERSERGIYMIVSQDGRALLLLRYPLLLSIILSPQLHGVVAAFWLSSLPFLRQFPSSFFVSLISQFSDVATMKPLAPRKRWNR